MNKEEYNDLLRILNEENVEVWNKKKIRELQKKSEKYSKKSDKLYKKEGDKLLKVLKEEEIEPVLYMTHDLDILELMLLIIKLSNAIIGRT